MGNSTICGYRRDARRRRVCARHGALHDRDRGREEPGLPAGAEIHEGIDQILTFVSGTGEARVAGAKKAVAQGDLVVVPAGTKHNFVNTGPNPLVLYTVYGPPEHADQAVHRTKEEADAAEAAGEDEPPTA
ncbi:cupin domain-containing protein [Micromonospora sp. NPDC048830]|uniref:cupin domain-containing protein n=1 Tax=Micromonospora sp. NPDC048830 TaxID=3364257 RepID=UPI00370FE853